MADAFQVAFEVGIPPNLFWGMTPWQLGRCISGYTKRKKSQNDFDTWLMWHGAVLQRAQKIPPLSEFIQEKKPIKKIDEAAIMARLKAYSRRFKECQ